MKAMRRVNWPEVRSSIRKHWFASIITAFIIVIVLIFAGYWFDWTGFKGKTFWDWLNLLGVLAIPVVVGFATTSYTAQQDKVREREQTDKHLETVLQAYIDNLSALLLHNRLRESGEDDEVRKIARVRTLTVLSRLDGKRKVSMLQFLYEAHLIDKDKKIVDLRGADLSQVDFFKVKLRAADLSGANFTGARFFEADLSEANLSGANFSQADLSLGNFRGANFRGADLIFADLEGAFIAGADFSGATYLEEVMKRAKSFQESMSELDEWYDKYGRPDKNDAKIAGDD